MKIVQLVAITHNTIYVLDSYGGIWRTDNACDATPRWSCVPGPYEGAGRPTRAELDPI